MLGILDHTDFSVGAGEREELVSGKRSPEESQMIKNMFFTWKSDDGEIARRIYVYGVREIFRHEYFRYRDLIR